MSEPRDPQNQDARRVYNRATHVATSGGQTVVDARAPSGSRTQVSGSAPTLGPRSPSASYSQAPEVLPPGDRQCRPLPSPVSLAGRGIVALAVVVGLHATAGFLALRDVERAQLALPRAFPGGVPESQLLEVLGADVGIGLFWVVAVAAAIGVAWLAERISNQAWVALFAAAALGLCQPMLGDQLDMRLAGWAVEAASWDPRGFAASSLPGPYGLMFVVAAIATFAGRRGDGLMLFAAIALALWLGWDVHVARGEGWRVVLEEAYSRAAMGIGRGDQLVAARSYLDGSREWLSLRSAADVLWLLAPAWIVGGATR